MAEVLIEIRGVNKVFDLGKIKVHALRDMSLEIFRGEYLSIMGPSGSGKSTLFNMIGALDRPTSGTVTIAGVDLASLSSRELAFFRGKHIGYVQRTQMAVCGQIPDLRVWLARLPARRPAPEGSGL